MWLNWYQIAVEFNPKSGCLEYPYCGQEKQIAQSSAAVIEQPYEAFLAANHTQIAALSTTAQEVESPGCHAQFAFEPPTIAGQCPFWDSVKESVTKDKVICKCCRGYAQNQSRQVQAVV